MEGMRFRLDTKGGEEEIGEEEMDSGACLWRYETESEHERGVA